MLWCVWRLQHIWSAKPPTVSGCLKHRTVHVASQVRNQVGWMLVFNPQKHRILQFRLNMCPFVPIFHPFFSLLGWSGNVLQAVGALSSRCAAPPGQSQRWCVRKTSARRFSNDSHQWHQLLLFLAILKSLCSLYLEYHFRQFCAWAVLQYFHEIRYAIIPA